MDPLLNAANAAQEGNLDTIKKIMEQDSANLNSRHPLSIGCYQTTQNTPLMIASVFNHPTVVTYLLDAGAEINAQNSSGDTALTLALSYNAFETAKILIKHSSNRLNVNNTSQNTALTIALRPREHPINAYMDSIKIQKKDIEEITELLIDRGANIRENSNFLISLACKWSSLKIVKLLLNKGISIKNNGEDSILSSLLHSSEKNIENKKEILKRLRTRGFNINTVFDAGMNPSLTPTLIYMISWNYYDLLEFVIKTRACDVNAQDEVGDTALIKIISKPDKELPYVMRVNLVTLLLEHGANAEILNKSKSSPLSIASERQEEDIIRLLNAKINKKNNQPLSRKWNFFISFLAGLTLLYPLIISLKYIAQLLYNAAQKDAHQPEQETTIKDDRLSRNHGYHRWAMHYEYYLEGKYGTKHTEKEIKKAIPEQHIRKTLGFSL